MEQHHQPDLERDEIRFAVLRERELNDALSYLDRAISNLAEDVPSSRWVHSHNRTPVQTKRPFAFLIERCVSAFRPEQRARISFNALPFH